MTVSDVFDIAFSRNKRAQRGKTATDEELLAALEHAMGRYFSKGQLLNLEWFLEEEQVRYVADVSGWPRPIKAEAVDEVQLENGQPVTKVPFDNQGVEKWKPAIFRRNQVYRIAAHPDRKVPNEVTTETVLTFFYSRRPNPIRSVTANLDPMWPTGHETLLGIDLALFMAQKDGSEIMVPLIPGLKDQLADALTWYLDFLRHEDRGTDYSTNRRRQWSYGHGMPKP